MVSKLSAFHETVFDCPGLVWCIIEASVLFYNALCMYSCVYDVWCICVRMLSRPTLSMAAAI